MEIRDKRKDKWKRMGKSVGISLVAARALPKPWGVFLLLEAAIGTS